MSPGGIGVDIKHNSYDRYLNKIKGKGPLRRGPIPPTFDIPVPFTLADPIYGDKRIKTNIITGCNCPDIEEEKDDTIIYGNQSSAIQEEIFNVNYTFSIGDNVWVQEYSNNPQYYQAKIINIIDNNYLVKFVNSNNTLWTIAENMLVYYDCGQCLPQSSLWEHFLQSGNPALCNLREIRIARQIL